ncbi:MULTISPECIES: hypothetical protein [Thioalkalivibrio]|uniref:Uncharacterized protein n=1 Tax=Thioalkalivibrio halophilus TaxID=252474 RepID=A0A1V2ZYZ7_9GAMM|nr:MULTISPECIES: hypothetical protein [Thioalkalivibrio]OOC10295.1 hypothetical protein B1A74_06565 [Thioalkalivibrio halophilus]
MNPEQKSILQRLTAVVVPAALLAFVVAAPAQAATPVKGAAGGATLQFSVEGLQEVRHDRRSGKRGYKHKRGHPGSRGHKYKRGHPGARGHKQSRRGHSRGRGPGHRSSRGAEHHHHYYGRSKRSGSRDRRDRRSSGSIHLKLPLPLPRL